MPLYEYECESCHRRFERIQKFSDPPIETCPVCGKGPVKKLLSSPAIQFKGSGWYITDYAKKSSGDTGSAGSTGTTGEKKPEGKSESSTKSDTSSSSSSSSTGTKSDT
jgi:putative FmdB family regulatory protein